MQVTVQTEFPPDPCNHNGFATRVILHEANAAEKKLMLLNDRDVRGGPTCRHQFCPDRGG